MRRHFVERRPAKENKTGQVNGNSWTALADCGSEKMMDQTLRPQRACLCFGFGEENVRFDSEADFASLALVGKNQDFHLERAL